MKSSIPIERGAAGTARTLAIFGGDGTGASNARRRGCALALSFLLPLILVVGGCAVGPNYKRPAVNVPADFRSAQGQAVQASLADLPWWEVFKDETLKGLIQTALTNNYDLRVAVSRVEQSRQIAVQARAQYFPFLNYSVASSDGRNEFGGTVSPNGGITRGTFIGGVNAAWEADVWGKIRRSNEAARAQYLSTEEARRGVMLSLVSEVAQAYYDLLGLELQLQIAVDTRDTFDESFKLFDERLQGGVSSKLDTSRAAGARDTAAGTIPELQRQIALTENQISVLLGANPGAIPHTAKLLDEPVPPDVPAGLPSALLERRPDVLTAEQQVRAANAQVGVAVANFFPQFGLTALLGRASTPLSLLSSGQANVWSIAGNVAGPIFEGGLLTAQKRQAVAYWEQSKLQYQETALNAFQDVANALVSRQKFEATRIEQVKAVQDYQESVKIALLRYRAGKASYFEVLEAQQLLFPAENALAQTELNRRIVIVQLYLALGGGWNLSDPQWTGAPIAPASPVAPAPAAVQKP
ncbi:MAG: efflux transporter outer membrane subunit [Candidatus Acidiferrales bacterium]